MIILSIFIALFLLFFEMCNKFYQERRLLLDRLDDIHTSSDEFEELNLPFQTRVLKPLLTNIEKLFGRLTPDSVKKNIAHRLHMAGNPVRSGITGWMTMQLLYVVVFPLMVLIILQIFQTGFLITAFFVIIALFIGLLFPNLVLKKKIRQKQKEIQKTLPDIIDLVTVSVEAGLTFDAAINKVGDKMPGHLAKLFNRALQEIKMGKPRKNAYKDMAMETGVDDLISFISAVIQADQLGVSVASILRVQCIQMRDKRRQRIQEVAMKAPVKMLIPMVLFIFPTIFIILLGPAIIISIEIFSK